MFKRHSETEEARDSCERLAIEHAWRIHAGLAEWTGKVDQKASFVLAIQSAVVAVVVTMSSKGGQFSGLHGADERVLYWAGLGFLGAGVLAAAAAVIPNLRKRRIEAEASQNYIFFGHLRSWKATDLERELRKNQILPVLSRQLVVMSEIAWQKHRRLQFSVWAAGLGVVLVGLSLAQHHHILSHLLDRLH